MKMISFLGAILFVCTAHFIRVLRWQLFVEIYEKPKTATMTNALSVGYLLNYFLPYKLGDVIRAYLAGRKMKNGSALAFSTVIVDRYLDVLSVGFVFLLLLIKDYNYVIQEALLFYIVLAIALLLLSVSVFCFRNTLKAIIKKVAGIFNTNIETKILFFAWALIWNFKDIFFKIRKLRLLIMTVGMWVCYIISYALFGWFLSSNGNTVSWQDIFVMLFSENSIRLSGFNIRQLGSVFAGVAPFYLVLYLLLPLGILILISFLIPKNSQRGTDDAYINLLPHLDNRERLAFLEYYFSNTDRNYIANYLQINQDVSIIRDYSAGSNATTMLCLKGDTTFFRKYALGAEGRKLFDQVTWIENQQGRIPLPQILKKEHTAHYCFYDMPYHNQAVGLFEYVHSMPIEKSWNIIRQVLDALDENIHSQKVSAADPEHIRKYIQDKVLGNLEKIKQNKQLKKILAYDTVVINGVEYPNLSYYDCYFSEDYLGRIFRNDYYADIHGDLTIENIICYRDSDNGQDFYVIDPNTGNIHNSPNLDYAKLLQSIHGGYEFMMSTREVKSAENHIDFLFTRSSAYMELHTLLKQYMYKKLGEDAVRSIYFHEIVHWLRLMPYKLEKDKKRALMFYAGMLMVLHDVIEMYGGKDTLQ